MNTIALESLYILDQPAEITAEWDDLLEQSMALEAFASELDDSLLYSAAIEAANGSEPDTSAAEISSKFRSGYKKISTGKTRGNRQMMAEGQREVDEASRELQAAERNAKTPEEKKKLSTVAKVAIAVAGAAALAVLGYVGVKNRDKLAAVIGRLKKNPGNSVADAISDVKAVTSETVKAVVEPKPVAVEEKPTATVSTPASTPTNADVNSKNAPPQKRRQEIQVPKVDPGRIRTSQKSTSEKKPSQVQTSTATASKETPAIKEAPKAAGPSREEIRARQERAEKIRATKAHNKELKNWAVVGGTELARTPDAIKNNPEYQDKYNELQEKIKDKKKLSAARRVSRIGSR